MSSTRKELLGLTESPSLKKDMEWLSAHRHNPFVKNGQVDADAYLEFVTQYNEFINHQPKPFIEMTGTIMLL